MLIRVLDLIAISLLFLVSCSEKSTHENDSTPPSSHFQSSPPNAQAQASNESVIVGRWQSRSNHTAPISGNYEMITTSIFNSDGSYEYSVIDTSNPNLGIQRSGQWGKLDDSIISANIKDTDSSKVYEHQYRIVDQNTIIDSYGKTFIRLAW